MSTPERLERYTRIREAFLEAASEAAGNRRIVAFALVTVDSAGEIHFGADYRAGGSAAAMLPKLRHMAHYMEKEK